MSGENATPTDTTEIQVDAAAPGNDDAFDSGFTDAQTTTPDAPVTEDKALEPAEPEPPKLAQITQEQYDELLSKAAKIDEITAETTRKFNTAFGQLGGLKQNLERIQSAPSGVQVTEEHFAEMKAEFPELADLTIKGLTKALSQLRGGSPDADPALVEQIVEKRVADTVAELRADAMDRLHDIVPGWDKGDKLKDIQTWAASQPEEIQKLANSDRIPDAAALLRKYRDRPTPPPEPKPAAPSTRQRQLEAAVTPRSAGGHSSAGSGVDPFDQGFNGS